MQTLLDKLKREQLHAQQTGRYPASSCPICLADFPPAGPSQGHASAAHRHEHSHDAAPSAPPLPGSSRPPSAKGDADLQEPLLGSARYAAISFGQSIHL